MPGERTHNTALIAPLPPSLIDLLSREHAFTLAREKLVIALNETRTHRKITQETRPPFLLLQRTKVRREIQSALDDAHETIELLECGITKLDNYAHQLHGLIAHRIENRIRTISDDYVRSLIAYFHRDDWHRLETRLEQYTSEFQSALIKLVRTGEELPRSADVTLQSHCRNLLLNAFRAAHQFETEIAFINRISYTQSKLSGLGEATLERQVALDWTASLHEIENARITVAITTLKHMAANHEEAASKALHSLKNEGRITHFSTSNEHLSYHAKKWALLRKSVQAPANPADIATLVEETERLLESGHIAQLALAEDDVVKVNKPPVHLEAALHSTTHTAPKPVGAPHTSSAPTLRLRNRHPKEPSAPHLPEASPAPHQPEKNTKISTRELAIMRKNVEQQRALLLEEKGKLDARAAFLEESHALLRISIEKYQECEALLNQRAKDLSTIEAQHQRHSPENTT